MDIKYPMRLKMANIRTASGNRVELTFDQHNGVYERFIGDPDDGNLAFLDQLVADANEAAQLKVDYKRLEDKIDDLVEARCTASFEKRFVHLVEKNRQYESNAFVDQETIKKLRECYDTVSEENGKLQRQLQDIKRYMHEQGWPTTTVSDKESYNAAKAVRERYIRDREEMAEKEAARKAEWFQKLDAGVEQEAQRDIHDVYREMGRLIGQTFGFGKKGE